MRNFHWPEEGILVLYISTAPLIFIWSWRMCWHFLIFKWTCSCSKMCNGAKFSLKWDPNTGLWYHFKFWHSADLPPLISTSAYIAHPQGQSIWPPLYTCHSPLYTCQPPTDIKFPLISTCMEVTFVSSVGGDIEELLKHC